RQKENFWSDAWDFFNVQGSKGSVILKNSESFIDSEWFPEAQLNYAENLLKHIIKNPLSDQAALVFWGEDQVKITLSKADLFQLVSRITQALKSAGLKKGDRVCGMLPNHPLTIAIMLSTVSLGGVWTSCSPDFGVQGVLDRFSQVTPKFFFGCDYYLYNGKRIDVLEKCELILKSLSSVEKAFYYNYDFSIDDLNAEENSSSKSEKNLKTITSFNNFIHSFVAKDIQFQPVEFNHPLYILYSSGTTGIPKCIVHGHGGSLLQHLKEHQFHGDISARDNFFYFTTCGWMMWNWLVSGLATDACLLLYDGSPFLHDGKILYQYAEEYRCTQFGTSAKFIDACSKANLVPKEKYNLSSIKTIFSTGSPLNAEGFDYVYENISSTAQLASISGGTDIVSCFVLGSPWTPIYRGEISVPGLGMDVDVWNENKNSLLQEKGELVCKSSFPSKPVSFWNDPEKEKFAKAYFSKFENIWCHGDFVEKTSHGGFIIYGRSDATLNPGGVRIGTAEIYRQVELLPEIEESIVIGQNWQNDVRVVLFVKLRTGLTLEDALIEKIKKQIRTNTTPRHVPSKVVQVNAIPRTKSGKIVELAVKQVVEGLEVKNKEALANPEALDEFSHRSELKN
ncbi:MAG: acetoacetate--CoA ligase, partial [Bdellovibrionales bacterium]|nr:acetoacetate--CoA ligase [Bdellovibrionales bacterium]